jgi:hypothetical protein
MDSADESGSHRQHGQTSRNYVTLSSRKLSAMVRTILGSRTIRTDNPGISLSGIKRKVAAVSMNQVILRKALEGLVKNNVIKTFKPINVSSQSSAASDDSRRQCQCTSCSILNPPKKSLEVFGTMPTRVTIPRLFPASVKSCSGGLGSW